jgi:NAD(P)-dependent dehydrogenase (short-subunit alcohol dehydrogenase family)
MKNKLNADSWQGKRVLITGASSGIGASLALEAAKLGAHLSLLARREDRLSDVKAQASRAGSRVVTFRGDITKTLEVNAAVENAVRELGGLDVVIANAGFGVAAPFEKLSNDDFRRQFDVNIFGVLRTIRAALPELKKSKGTIAIIASVSSYVSAGSDSPYAMSKAAIRALADSLYLELKPEGVSVCLICPGFIDSEIRSVDNKGVFHAKATDPIPKWIRMSADTAATQILGGILAKKRELVITRHGKLLIWLRRFAPSLLIFLITKLGLLRREQV